MTRDRISNLSAHGFATKIGVYALGMVTSVAIARALGPEGRGAYFIPVTAAAITFQIASIGLPEAQFRLFSRHRVAQGQLLSSGVLSTVLAGTLGAGVTFFLYAINVAGVFDDVDVSSMLIALVPVPFMIHVPVLTMHLAWGGRLRLANTARLVGAVVQTAGAAFLYLSGALTVDWVLFLWALTFFIPWLIRWRGVLRIEKPARIGPGLLRRQLVLGMGYLPSALFLYLNLRLDVFFLARFQDLGVVGIYSVAVIFGELIWLATDSITLAITERQANADLAEMSDVTARAIRMNVLLALLLGAVVGVVGQVAIPLVYGQEFAPAAVLVWLLVPAALAMSVWRTSIPVLMRASSAWHPAAIAAGALVTNIVANLLLVPDHGARGAAIASTLSYGFGAVAAATLMLARTPLSFGDLIPSGRDLRALFSRTRDLIREGTL